MISSFAIWVLATSALFDYIIQLYPEEAFGEPIWVIDPLGFLMISVPTGLVFLIGLIAVFGYILKDVQ
jgi:hypothetical protein